MSASLLYGLEKGGNASGAAEFITRLLNAVTVVHMHHLMTDSYAKHMALGDLYDGLQDAADSLAEAYMGCSGQKLTFNGGTVSIGGDAVADVQALYSYVETARLQMGAESYIQNEIDGICTLISSALYKLTRLS